MNFKEYVKTRTSEEFWKFVKANSDKNWDYADLSSNPLITWEIVQANPDWKWIWQHLSKNPNITWEIVQSNPNKI